MARNSVKLSYRQGLSIARGTTIDEYLDPKDVERLYERWQETWPEPFKFSGGITAITAEMILEVSVADFYKIFGPNVGKRIRDIAENNAGR